MKAASNWSIPNNWKPGQTVCMSHKITAQHGGAIDIWAKCIDNDTVMSGYDNQMSGWTRWPVVDTSARAYKGFYMMGRADTQATIASYKVKIPSTFKCKTR